MKSKTITRKLTVLALAATFAFSFTAVGCKDEKETVVIPSLPDYSATNYKFYFSGAIDKGEKKINGETMFIEELDLANEEDIRTYIEMGNNIGRLGRAYYPLGENEKWADSKVKKAGDLMYSLGIEKTYIGDALFTLWAESTAIKIVDAENGRFKTEEELDAFVTERIKDYVAEPWVYGVDLTDEPSYKRLPNISTISASIHRCSKALGRELKTFSNLHPSTAGTGQFAASYTTAREAYELYLEASVKDSLTDNISVDHYPFMDGGNTRGYFATLQTQRDICDKYGVDMEFYAHSFCDYQKGAMRYRDIDQSMMYWNINTLVGFGVKTIHWYRYSASVGYTKGLQGQNDAWFYDKGSLVDRRGNPTNLYYYAKEIVEECQAFSNVILNYDYQGGKFYSQEGVSKFNMHYLKDNNMDKASQTANTWDNSYELNLVKDVEMTNETVFMTELFDDDNQLYMYMVMNPIDPYYTKTNDTVQTVTIDFGSEHEWVAEFDQGVLNYVKLDNGKYTKTLSAGYASYVVPLNKDGKQVFTAADASRDRFRDEWWK